MDMGNYQIAVQKLNYIKRRENGNGAEKMFSRLM